MSKFFKASAIRAIRTMCQTAVAVIGSATLISEVNWSVVISSVLLSGILSLLTSISTGLPEVDRYGEDNEMDYLDYDDEVDDYE